MINNLEESDAVYISLKNSIALPERFDNEKYVRAIFLRENNGGIWVSCINDCQNTDSFIPLGDIDRMFKIHNDIENGEESYQATLQSG